MELPQNAEGYIERSQARRVEIAREIASLTREWDELFADEVQIKTALARTRHDEVLSVHTGS